MANLCSCLRLEGSSCRTIGLRPLACLQEGARTTAAGDVDHQENLVGRPTGPLADGTFLGPLVEGAGLSIETDGHGRF